MNKVIVIVGPTAIGKTCLSIELAKEFDGEIINADSMQIYKGNDVATAKIKDEEMQNIKHHLLSIKNLDEDYTVYNYQIDARNCIDDIIKRGKTPIIVGGTGLYIKATLYNYDFKEEEKQSNDYSNFSNEELYQKLLEIDSCTPIHPNNRKRIERALNYYYSHNCSINSKEKSNKILYDAYFIGLTTNRDKLYERIDKRVDKMIQNGLIDEAKKMYDFHLNSKAILTPIGYKELFPYFKKEKTIEECIETIKQNSRRYAKRQYTFFNNQMDVRWFDVDFNNFNKTIEEIINYIRSDNNV